MKKRQNLLVLALKGIVYIYLPVILLLFVIYKVILGRDINLPLDRAMIYVVIVGMWSITNYINKLVELDIKDFTSMKDSIIKGRWEITKQDTNMLLVKPKFDFPFRLFIDNTVKVDYSNQRASIEGPSFYVNNLVKEIERKGGIWTKKSTGIVGLVLIILLVSAPVLSDLGVFWSIKGISHNNFLKNVEIIEINSEDVLGNTVENTNNYGLTVENDDYIFYVQDSLNLVRVNKSFQDKKYLIQKNGGSGIMRLNIAGDWIYYNSGETLNRISIDGTNDETIYKLSYLLDIHMKDNWIYFINFSDDASVYKMDINGRNLEKFSNINVVNDIAIYDDRMIFSHSKDGKGYVESIKLDGSDRRLEFEEIVNNDLIKLEDYYYYIGDNYRLYRKSINETTEPPQMLVDNKVSSYTIVDENIYYSLHSEDAGYPGQDVYKIGLDGTNNTLIMETNRVSGFGKVGQWILFHSSDKQSSEVLKRLDVLTDKIEIIE